MQVAASLFRLGAEVPSDWVASLSQQVRQYTEVSVYVWWCSLYAGRVPLPTVDW
jgi:hypothetical protein